MLFSSEAIGISPMRVLVRALIVVGLMLAASAARGDVDGASPLTPQQLRSVHQVDENALKYWNKHSAPVPDHCPIVPDHEIYDACKNMKKTTVTIEFPAREGCGWDRNGNLGKRNGWLQARHEQSHTLVIADGPRILCGINIASKTDELFYDDYLFFNLNNHVLAATNKPALSYLNRSAPDVEPEYFWDFARVRGTRHVDPFVDDPWCLPGLDACTIPPHFQRGEFLLQSSLEGLLPFTRRLGDFEALDFTLVVTGDDNDRSGGENDCKHTGLQLDVQVWTAPKPASM